MSVIELSMKGGSLEGTGYCPGSGYNPSPAILFDTLHVNCCRSHDTIEMSTRSGRVSTPGDVVFAMRAIGEPKSEL